MVLGVFEVGCCCGKTPGQKVYKLHPDKPIFLSWGFSHLWSNPDPLCSIQLLLLLHHRCNLHCLLLRTAEEPRHGSGLRRPLAGACGLWLPKPVFGCNPAAKGSLADQDACTCCMLGKVPHSVLNLTSCVQCANRSTDRFISGAMLPLQQILSSLTNGLRTPFQLLNNILMTSDGLQLCLACPRQISVGSNLLAPHPISRDIFHWAIHGFPWVGRGETEERPEIGEVFNGFLAA